MGGPDQLEMATDTQADRNPEEQFLQTMLHGDVDRALTTLPLAFREVVMLVDIEGLTYREVAEVVGCPIGTVRSRLHRGRKMLQKALWQVAEEGGIISHHTTGAGE